MKYLRSTMMGLACLLLGSGAAFGHAISIGWQDVTFSNLGPGLYRFTYQPNANPSQEWSLLSLRMNGVFDLSGVIVRGDITLSPSLATNVFGTAHTVCATVIVVTNGVTNRVV